MPEFWPHAPREVREILDFRTDVRSHPTGEVRDSLRDASQRLSLVSTRSPREATRALARMRANPAGEWYVPLWQDATFVSGGVAAGSGSIEVNTDADYRAGGLAVVWASETSWELVDVDEAAGGVLSLLGSPGVVGNFPGPVIVAPVATCIAPEGLRLTRSYAVETFGVEFLRLDHADLGAWSGPTFGDLPVLAGAGVVVSELEAGVRQSLELIDSGFGSYALESLETFTRQRSLVSFADDEVGARWARRRLMHYLRGRDGAFWLPSYRRDFDLLTSFSSTLIQVAPEGWPAVSGLIGRGLEIDTGAGLIHRSIVNASVLGGVLRLSIDSVPGVTVPVTARLSLMARHRLDSDRVEFEHQFLGRGFLSVCRVPTIEVPA